MRDPAEFQEIENLGTDRLEEEVKEEKRERPQRESDGSFLPIFQAILCALALLALACCKFMVPETYGKAVDWYQKEAAREIELPKWVRDSGKDAARPSQAASGAPLSAELEDGSLRRV